MSSKDPNAAIIIKFVTRTAHDQFFDNKNKLKDINVKYLGVVDKLSYSENKTAIHKSLTKNTQLL